MSRGIKYFIRHSMPFGLAEFLRKNKCTEKYINNTYNYLVACCLIRHCSQTKTTKNYRFYTNLRRMINNIYIGDSLTSILYGSFIWYRTPEGSLFWSNIYDKAVTFQEQYK